MTYTTHNQENRIATIGTSLQGYVSVNYATLRELFGKPLDGDGYKVDAEWIIQFDDGTVATIYNYKDGKNYNGEDGTETTEITEWHIGGNNPRSVYLVKELIDDIPVETPVSKPTIEQIVEELAARLSRLEVFTGMVAPVPLPVARIAAQQASDAKFDAALAMRARDDHDEMATWLTEQIGESVQHHPIENLRIFMERQIHNLEAGL